MNLNRLIQPQNIFLILALIFGISFLFIIPPFQVPDENSHFYKAYYVSEGHIIPDNDFYFPRSLNSTMETFIPLHSNPRDPHTLENIFKYMKISLNKNDRIYVNISNIAIYPPVPYLASAFIISIGKLFDLSPLILMYLGRLVNLLIFIFLTYFAIKITPIHKWVFLLLAVMPMTLQQAASFSADSLTIALSFLTIAFFLKLALINKNIDIKDIISLFALIFILALSKQAYTFLLILLFIIPLNKFKNNRNLIFAAIGSITLIFTLLWNYLFKDLYIANFNPLINPSGQISFILANPLQFVNILLDTIIIQFKPYLIMFVGDLGWLSVNLPELMVYLYLGVLIIVALIDKNELMVNKRQKLISLIIFLIISFSVFIFEYITWTPVGSGFIEGVQGRYFIPIMPLLLLLFYNTKSSVKIYNNFINFKMSKVKKILITMFIIIFLSFTLRILLFTYYLTK